MEVDDIVYAISTHINDYHDLIQFCYINQNNMRICSQPGFWIHIFNEWGLPIPEQLPTNLNEWVKEFYARYHTNDILFELSQTKSINPNFSTSGSITFYQFNHIKQELDYFIKLFKLIGIDTQPYYTYLNTNHFHIEDNTLNIKQLFILYYHNIGIYRIMIDFNNTLHNKYKPSLMFNDITLSQITTFLYNSLYDNAL